MSGGGWGEDRDQPRYGQPRTREGLAQERSTPSQPRISGDPEYRGRHAARTEEVPVQRPVQPVPDYVSPPEGTRVAPPSQPSHLSNLAVSFLRTYVPILWGAIVSWGVTQWPFLGDVLDTSGLTVAAPVALTALATAVWYTVWRWLEPRVPNVLSTLALGHPAPPRYPE